MELVPVSMYDQENLQKELQDLLDCVFITIPTTCGTTATPRMMPTLVAQQMETTTQAVALKQIPTTLNGCSANLFDCLAEETGRGDGNGCLFGRPLNNTVNWPTNY